MKLSVNKVISVVLIILFLSGCGNLHIRNPHDLDIDKTIDR